MASNIGIAIDIDGYLVSEEITVVSYSGSSAFVISLVVYPVCS